MTDLQKQGVSKDELSSQWEEIMGGFITDSNKEMMDQVRNKFLDTKVFDNRMNTLFWTS